MSVVLQSQCLKISHNIQEELGELGSQLRALQGKQSGDSRSAIESDTLNKCVAFQGRISASIASLERKIQHYKTVSGYNHEQKNNESTNELQSLNEDVENFKKTLRDYRQIFAALRHDVQRRELLSSQAGQSDFGVSNSRLERRRNLRNDSGYPVANQRHRESEFITNVENELDRLIDSGQFALGDLREQNSIIKNIKQKIWNSTSFMRTSLGLINQIERRAREDKIVFFTALIVTFVLMYVIYRLLRS